MTTAEIDRAILACAKQSWSKVALIILRVADRIGGDFRDNKSSYALIADRIKSMTYHGTLISQGNLDRWRYSETKLPSDKAEQGAAVNP